MMKKSSRYNYVGSASHQVQSWNYESFDDGKWYNGGSQLDWQKIKHYT